VVTHLPEVTAASAVVTQAVLAEAIPSAASTPVPALLPVPTRTASLAAQSPRTNFRIRTYGFGNNCYGYRCGYGSGWGYPYLYGGIDSYWWWDNDSDNGYDPGQPYNYDNGLANQMQQQGIPLRPPDPEDQNYSARSMPQHHEERTEASTPTVLVFRDQHTQEVQNYAIVGETLWTFAPQKTQKIPLDDLDLPATQKVNDERGVTFRIPNAGEGQ
jgi:hypothetical protein